MCASKCAANNSPVSSLMSQDGVNACVWRIHVFSPVALAPGIIFTTKPVQLQKLFKGKQFMDRNTKKLIRREKFILK